ncbi:MAG: transposase [Treponema sp.]|nr:transposase [Treponema sp.]
MGGAPVEKHEKPVSHVAVALGVNEQLLYRWIQQTRETAGSDLPSSP